MAVYNKVSVESVIARILRNTKNTDLTYADDIYEWINEAADLFSLKKDLPRKFKELDIHCHAAQVPCELVELDGVFYNGCRLRKGSTQLAVEASRIKTSDLLETYFVHDESVIPTEQNSQNYALIRGLDLRQVVDYHTSAFYYTEGPYIKTSFDEGCIEIFYRIRNTDKEGLPFIPDVEEVKQYCFWYVAGMLCMTGFKFPDPSITWAVCDIKTREWLKTAKKKIRIPSKDDKELALQSWVSLIPPTNYYRTYFAGTTV